MIIKECLELATGWEREFTLDYQGRDWTLCLIWDGDSLYIDPYSGDVEDFKELALSDPELDLDWKQLADHLLDLTDNFEGKE
jgi:hypothetical protein